MDKGSIFSMALFSYILHLITGVMALREKLKKSEFTQSADPDKMN